MNHKITFYPKCSGAVSYERRARYICVSSVQRELNDEKKTMRYIDPLCYHETEGEKDALLYQVVIK